MKDYRFYNANPLNEIESDCVCRAICKATDLPYYDIQRKLELIGELFECDKLCVCCYHHLLEKVFGLTQRVAVNKKVKDISRLYKDKKVIIRIKGHLTTSIYGTIYDIWDCTKEDADVYWIVE